MGLTHVTVALKGFDASNGSYEADFLVDTGATDCLASALELKKIGVREVGRRWNRLGSPSIPQVARLSVCRRFRWS